MKLALGFLTLVALLIAYSAGKNFWTGPMAAVKNQAMMKEEGLGKYEKAIGPLGSTPVPTSTTSTTTSTCDNGCTITIGTSNAPTAPPPYNTNYNGRNPLIQSYPTTQP